ncbi:cytochrome c oxidase subunit II [Massilia solisilvae]|uniref:cytochrome-c oxidase n=1 Tax=Massilia solisilvae TaxID=1811225 RepID=A0ABT2BIP8_9BURK|nr:cytochrome c oxidase subunit II [Massilia solisilvae]
MNPPVEILPAASSAAGPFDLLMLALLLLSTLMAVALALMVIGFSIRFRAGSRAERPGPVRHRRAIEYAWTGIPLLLFCAIYAWAAYDYAQLFRPPAGAMPVFVVAKQWMWKLEHRNGRREIGELHVPLGQPVRLVMTSQDVIHSFFVPAFRLKQDVVPGRYTTLAFTATKLGRFHLFCAEYCGTEHSLMRGEIVVMRPAEFEQWLQQGADTPGIAARGFALYRRYGCSGCHEPGSSVHAPSLAHLVGRTVHLQDGRTLVADENYVRDSILLPRKDIVAGYGPDMPSFAGQISEEDLLAIIAYIREKPDER